MNITPIEFANFELVEINTSNESRPTPHCKNQRAMNKITPEGIWRCITATGFKDVVQGNSKSKVHMETICRAGCFEKKL